MTTKTFGLVEKVIEAMKRESDASKMADHYEGLAGSYRLTHRKIEQAMRDTQQDLWTSMKEEADGRSNA